LSTKTLTGENAPAVKAIVLHLKPYILAHLTETSRKMDALRGNMILLVRDQAGGLDRGATIDDTQTQLQALTTYYDRAVLAINQVFGPLGEEISV
jgi:hypothetical protein